MSEVDGVVYKNIIKDHSFLWYKGKSHCSLLKGFYYLSIVTHVLSIEFRDLSDIDRLKIHIQKKSQTTSRIFFLNLKADSRQDFHKVSHYGGVNIKRVRPELLQSFINFDTSLKRV